MSHFGGYGPVVLGVMWAETLLALIFVLLRLYTRRFIVRNIGWDDHLITITMVLFFGYTTLCTIAAFNDMGTHAADLGLTQTVTAVKWEIAAQTFNIAAIATSKNSVAVFLIRIVIQKSHTWFLWFCIFSTSFICASCIIFMFTQCTPLESIFNPTLPRTCYLNFTANAIFSGSYTATMDFTLAIFPWFILWQLNMKRKERLTIAFGLSLGAFAGVCGIVRAVQLQSVSGKADYTFLTVPVILWGSSELLVCIICASIPVLRPLYKRIHAGHGSSSAPYELGDAPSQQLATGQGHGSKGSRKTGYGAGYGSGSVSRNTMVTATGGLSNDSEEDMILKDGTGLGSSPKERSEGGFGNITKTMQVEVSYT